jgi:hypothetical protein
MKKKYSRLIFISAISVISALYFFQESKNHPKNSEFIFSENISDNKDKIIEKIKSESLGDIYLKSGNEKFGLTHILMRHSSDYYSDYKNKGTLFPKSTTEKEIIDAIKQVAESGISDPKAKGDSKALKKELYLHGEKANYRLIVSDENEIITFFKTD